MEPTCCIFVLSRIVMPSRGPKCLKIYYSRLEDRALTKQLVVFLGSSPRAKNLLKRVVNRVLPAATLLHAPRRRPPFQISPQRAGWNWIWTFKFQKKMCLARRNAPHTRRRARGYGQRYDVVQLSFNFDEFAMFMMHGTSTCLNFDSTSMQHGPHSHHLTLLTIEQPHPTRSTHATGTGGRS